MSKFKVTLEVSTYVSAEVEAESCRQKHKKNYLKLLKSSKIILKKITILEILSETVLLLVCMKFTKKKNQNKKLFKTMIKNQELAETAIREARKNIDYNTAEFPLEYFIDKISQQEIDNNLNWDESKQSYFIESLMLGLPVFNIVFKERDGDDNWSEFYSVEQLIDGRQRLYTALNFINGNLQLSNLKVIESLNGFTFTDLPLSRQRRFKRTTVKAIAVAPNSDLSVWREHR